MAYPSEIEEMPKQSDSLQEKIILRGKKADISVTDEPEQVMYFHDCPQGSPPLAVQPPVSWPGELRLLNNVLRAETASWNIQRQEEIKIKKKTSNLRYQDQMPIKLNQSGYV